MRILCLTLLAGTAAIAAAAEAREESTPAAAYKVTSIVRGDARTGKLVRSVLIGGRGTKPAGASAKPKASAKPASTPNEIPFIETDMNELIERTAKAHDVDPLLVHSVIRVESGYNQFAISPKGAVGLMQLMPATARRFGVKNTFDARENVEGGVRYLRHLQNLYKDDRLALAAYNSGEGAVEKYGNNVPPYQETIGYVRKVGEGYSAARQKHEERNATLAGDVPTSDQEQYRKLEEVVGADGRIVLRTR